MDNKPLFSIVMPVYNVEKYLRDAVESVLQQTYPRFELLLVDDCSPDNSPAICDELAATDARIRVIHKPVNEGLSLARNTGIEAATGDYVCFMDSDDTVDSSLLMSVAESLIANPADCVMFGMTEEYLDEAGMIKEEFVITYPAKILTTENQLRKEIIHIENSTLYGYSANKFYDLAFIKNRGLRFYSVPLIEDIRFNVDFFMQATSLNILSAAPYHYKKRGRGSLTEVFVPEYFKLHRERVSMLKNQYVAWNMYAPEVKVILGNIYSRYVFSALQRNFDNRSGMNSKDRKEWVKNLFEDDLFNELIPAAQPDSSIFKMMTLCLKSRSVVLSLLSSRAIFIVKNKSPILFAKAKQNR